VDCRGWCIVVQLLLCGERWDVQWCSRRNRWIVSGGCDDGDSDGAGSELSV